MSADVATGDTVPARGAFSARNLAQLGWIRDICAGTVAQRRNNVATGDF